MNRLLQAQTEALAAQTRAAVAQHLPPLKPFSGEGKITDDSSFERWIEQFEERARVIGRSEAQQLHQLKLLLEKTALKVFQMFPTEDKASYARAKAALKARFRSVDIEELQGMEFHRVVQGNESVEELGMEIQRLGHRAFPSVKGRDLDRLLKGQALHPRWQRKLGAPKLEETFQELFDRARMFEQRESSMLSQQRYMREVTVHDMVRSPLASMARGTVDSGGSLLRQGQAELQAGLQELQAELLVELQVVVTPSHHQLGCALHISSRDTMHGIVLSTCQ